MTATQRADVQLEHGYVRIANRLVEAILDTAFTGAQVRILLALVRLTYGWRQRTVTISMPHLAERANQAPVGGFRRALHELIEAGVVLVVEQGAGQRPTTFAVQKDFTQWGRFSVAPGRLASVWGERPESRDALISATPRGQGEGGVTPQGSDPAGSVRVTLQGQSEGPHRVTPTTPNENDDTDLDERKDRKDRKDSTTPPPPPLRARDTNPKYLEVRGQLAPEFHADFDRLLDLVPEASTWCAAIAARLPTGAMHGKPHDPAHVGEGIRQFLMAGRAADAKPIQFWRFVETAAEPQPPAGSTGAGRPGGTARNQPAPAKSYEYTPTESEDNAKWQD